MLILTFFNVCHCCFLRWCYADVTSRQGLTNCHWYWSCGYFWGWERAGPKIFDSGTLAKWKTLRGLKEKTGKMKEIPLKSYWLMKTSRMWPWWAKMARKWAHIARSWGTRAPSWEASWWRASTRTPSSTWAWLQIARCCLCICLCMCFCPSLCFVFVFHLSLHCLCQLVSFIPSH